MARLLLVANVKVDWTRLGLGFRKLLFARKFKLTADLGGPRLIMLISPHRVKCGATKLGCERAKSPFSN